MSAELTFYGDDFTGSTDVALQYLRFGLRTRLVTEVPTPARARELARDVDVLGIAGMTRSLATDEIAAVLDPAFAALSAIEPRLVQYKVCSTADSSPQIGSFGPAIALGRRRFGQRPVGLLVAQTDLRRYTVFGHHFAADGDTVYRLDRQPAMAHHPVTPMGESDLRVHLRAQTDVEVDSVDWTELRGDGGVQRWGEFARRGVGLIVLDGLEEEDLRAGARLVLEDSAGGPAFALGSGGLNRGVAAVLTGRGPSLDGAGIEATDAVLAVSGSRSGLTARQIAAAVDAGWTQLALDLAAIAAGGEAREREVHRAIEQAGDGLARGPGAIVHSTPDGEPADPAPDVAELGDALGQIVRGCRVVSPELARVIVAGGDTSGYVTRTLGAESLEAVGPVGGALLCRVSSGDREATGLELVLKGGQIGTETLFETTRTGHG